MEKEKLIFDIEQIMKRLSRKSEIHEKFKGFYEFAKDLMQHDYVTLIKNRPKIKNGEWYDSGLEMYKEAIKDGFTDKDIVLDKSSWIFGYVNPNNKNRKIKVKPNECPLFSFFTIRKINYSKDTIMRMDFNILTNKLEQEETITLGVEAREENFSFSDIPFLQEVCNRYKKNKSLYLDEIDEFKALTESLKNILIKDFI